MPENAVQHHPTSPDPVLIVGAVTWDVVNGERVPGGAATYAARTATALGVRAYILVAAGEDAGLAAFADHELAVVPVEQTMMLEHRFHDGTRQQRVLARPERPLRPSDRPAHWPAPRTMILGPLLPDDIDVAAFLDLDSPEETAVIAQGLQRTVGSDGTIEHLERPSAALLDAARPGVTICLSAEETARWSSDAVDSLVARSRRVVRTLGAGGAEIRTRVAGMDGVERVRQVPALDAAVVDTTGAGDVFATALILAMRTGDEVAERLAAACAAACVERHGSASLPARAELEDRAGITPDSRSDRSGRDGAQGDRS